MISVRFQGKSFNITVTKDYVPTSNAKEAETEWFYEDLDNCDIEWFALEMSRVYSAFLRLHPSTAFWTLLLTMMATPFLLRDSCLQ